MQGVGFRSMEGESCEYRHDTQARMSDPWGGTSASEVRGTRHRWKCAQGVHDEGKKHMQECCGEPSQRYTKQRRNARQRNEHARAIGSSSATPRSSTSASVQNKTLGAWVGRNAGEAESGRARERIALHDVRGTFRATQQLTFSRVVKRSDFGRNKRTHAPCTRALVAR